MPVREITHPPDWRLTYDSGTFMVIA